MTPGEGTGVTFPGRINIATAELPVLFALVPAENNDLVETLDELRRDMVSGKQTVNLKNPNWLTQIPGLAGLKLDPKLITTSSDVFRVESTADAARRRHHHHRRGAARAGAPDGQVDLPDPELAGRLSRQRARD